MWYTAATAIRAIRLLTVCTPCPAPPATRTLKSILIVSVSSGYDDRPAAGVARETRFPGGAAGPTARGKRFPLPGFPEGPHDVLEGHLRDEIIAPCAGEVSLRLGEVELRVVHVQAGLDPELESLLGHHPQALRMGDGAGEGLDDLAGFPDSVDRPAHLERDRVEEFRLVDPQGSLIAFRLGHLSSRAQAVENGVGEEQARRPYLPVRIGLADVELPPSVLRLQVQAGLVVGVGDRDHLPGDPDAVPE